MKILRITNKNSFLKNMFGVKRPRSRTMGKGPVYGKPARKIIRRVPRVVPGVTRVGGYYGRFSGANAEQKFFDVSCSVPDIDQITGALVPSINIVQQNTKENGRIGRKITIRSVQLSGFCGSGYSSRPTQIRVALVLDKQCNGAAATVGAVYENQGTVGSPIYNSTSFRNLENLDRFVILMSKTFLVQPLAVSTSTLGGAVTTTNTASNSTHRLDAFKRVNIPVIFSDLPATSDITSIRSNNLFLVYTSLDASSSNDVILNTRIRFTDE